MRALSITSCLIFAFGIMACSNHWRDANAQLTAQDVQKIIADIEQSQAAALSGSNLSTALALKDDPNASVYFADAPSPIGQVVNILGFFTYEFLGYPADFGYKNIYAARVLYFDAPQDDGTRKSALIIGIRKSENESFEYHAFVGSASVADKNDYEGALNDESGNLALIVKTFDYDDGLDTVIQLKVYRSDGAYLGKIATLVGFKY